MGTSSLQANDFSVDRRRRRRRRAQPISEINVTPFVDVMLVLLIIFMIAAPLLSTGVPLDLPQAQAAALPQNREPVTVSVDRNARVFLQDDEIAISELGARLRALVDDKGATRILVRGDTNANYGIVMRVMGRINAAGFSKVGLITEPER